MTFIKEYLWKKDYRKSLTFIILIFSLFYLLCNIPFINLINFNELNPGPFEYSAFDINLFNMDPVLFQAGSTISLRHPFLNYLAILYSFFNSKLALYFIILIQSLVGALSVALIFIFMKNIKLSNLHSYIITILFGVFSYSIISTLVPDSYLYAQLALISSIVYMQYSILEKCFNPIGYVVLGIFNFGITITNFIPYTINMLIANFTLKNKNFLKNLLKTIFIGLLLVILLSCTQFLISDKPWFMDISNSFESESAPYAQTYDEQLHPNAINAFIGSPIMLGSLTFKDGTFAVVTNLLINMPAYVKLIIYLILILCVTSIVLNIKQRETWIILSIICFNMFIHLVKGFGLSTYLYDVYLYAGHYIFVIPMLLGMLLKRFNNKKKITNIFMVLLCTITLIIFAHNIFMEFNLYNFVKSYYLM